MDIGKYRAEKAPPSALHDKYREVLNKVICDTAVQEQRIRDRQVRERIRERRSKGPDESADAMITAMRKLASESEAELEEMHQLVHKERWEHHRAACDQFMEHFPDLSAEESSNGQMPLHQKIRNAYMRSSGAENEELRMPYNPVLRCPPVVAYSLLSPDAAASEAPFKKALEESPASLTVSRAHA
eukprot:jgi/Chrpa1/28015/Chrysochromulina_OHIO_Genome00017825-RA